MNSFSSPLIQNETNPRIVSARRWQLLVVLIAVSLALTITSIKSRGNPNLVQSLILNVFSPFQWTFSSGTRSIGGWWRGYANLVGVKKENEKLSNRVRQLQSEVNKLREAEIKLWRLQRLMGFNVEKHIEAVPAEVIGREADNWSRMILLNRGTEDGVEKSMAVITSEGLLGRVAQASDNKAKVLLITDWRSSVDSLIQRTRARGIVVGKSSRAGEMRYIPLNADVRVGDKVLSSGLGGVFPKGLMVGMVIKVTKERNGLFQKATVIPFVDAGEVEEALVVLRYGG